MTKKKTYTSALSFRTALETRLLQISQNERLDINKLRKQFTFDRFLARLFSAKQSIPWALKGGHALQLRLSRARATRDVDLVLKELRILSENSSEREAALLALLSEQTSQELGDYFEYQISGPIMELENAPLGGSRFLIEARMDGRTFDRFHIDIAFGDLWIEPLDSVAPRAWLDFAGIDTQPFPVIPKEQHFAEKLHAYTRPMPEGVINSRSKDLVDMLLLIGTGELDASRLASIINATFKRRGTHTVSKDLDPPPDSWLVTYTSLAKECGITLDMPASYQALKDFVKKLPL